MSTSQATGSQAGQSSQSSGSGGTQEDKGQQSLGTQVFGQQSQQTQQDQETRFEGQRDGESLADFAKRVNSELTRARQDAGKYRTELRKYQGSEQVGEDGLTEFQRLERQLGTLKSDLDAEREARKAERLTTSLVTALAEAGATNPTRAARLIDVATELELGADGVPTAESVATAIANLQRDTPGIFNAIRGNGDGGAGNRDRPDPQDFNALIRARAGVRAN